MMAAVQPKKWNWWYDRISDWMIANPDKLLRDCARELKCTQSWLSTIIHSDMFQDHWKIKSKNFSDAALLGVREKGYAAAELALDALNRRLETQADVLPITTLLEITDVTMKRFGYGADKKAPGSPVQNNYYLGTVSSTELADARANAVRAAEGRRESRELVVVDQGEGASAPGDGENGRGVDP